MVDLRINLWRTSPSASDAEFNSKNSGKKKVEKMPSKNYFWPKNGQIFDIFLEAKNGIFYIFIRCRI
jgi:hypothetical protein